MTSRQKIRNRLKKLWGESRANAAEICFGHGESYGSESYGWQIKPSGAKKRECWGRTLEDTLMYIDTLIES